MFTKVNQIFKIQISSDFCHYFWGKGSRAGRVGVILFYFFVAAIKANMYEKYHMLVTFLLFLFSTYFEKYISNSLCIFEVLLLFRLRTRWCQPAQVCNTQTKIMITTAFNWGQHLTCIKACFVLRSPFVHEKIEALEKRSNLLNVI